jgi:secreted trypsin-like serine protease
MTRKRSFAVLAGIALALAAAGQAGAIQNGTPDPAGANYPSVGMVRFTQGGTAFRCSGTLIAPKIVLTAAHCTEGSTNVRVTWAGVADPAVIDESAFIHGTPYTHPGWTGKLGTKLLKDTGLIVLEHAPAGVPIAPLAPVGYLDTIDSKRASYTMVGYGVEYAKPEDGPQKRQAVRDFIRKFASATLQNLTVDVIKLQNNISDARDDGGSCGGDSGGPVYVDGYVAGDDSWGTSQFCGVGAGGYQRIDTPAVRDWINGIIAANP